ncbi:MAG: ribosome small subunit-dependent GTPase A [Bryobacterales bacterium]|nr:ribosome small subunit-dependent GTPase A [Bryobacterales bacterium]
MNSSDFPVRARVCEAAQEHYCLRFEDHSECEAVPAGALRWSAELPAVGDWVCARRADATLALIESVEPRSTCISRQRPGGGGEQVLAANVDLIVIVMGLDGDYNLRRLERYLVLAAASGAQAMAVLNKKDACPEWQTRLADVRSITSKAVALSAHESVAPIAEVVRGWTTVLLGSSGAGKSTITNALLGNSRQTTQPVRESDSRGRHTTTHRMLIGLPGGGSLIDTPGLRELALWAGQDSVDEVFDGIATLAQQCRFRDCTHNGEPGCAVSAACETGELDPARWNSYQKLLAEARYHERSVDPRAAAETKRKWKVIHKALRHHPKYRDQ